VPSRHRSCAPAHLSRLTIALLAARNRPQTSFPRWVNVEEEADETLLWIELLEESELVTAAKLTAIKQEANELIAITVASIKTARRNRAP